ncbi:MAG: DegT/DnrJ/EryC1/StrS family aminotransferase, partial [Muribaculaceae bacterium]|nr:DegT/DnrJ/EryC1/StrS family aminotransferase [Muribaculaceae bacterium]
MKYPFLELDTVNRPYAAELKQAVGRVIDSGRYCGGPEVDDFERRMAHLTGAAHVVGVSNGLDALRLILRAYILIGAMAPGDEVIVPANSFIASALAISDSGLKPVVAEPSALTHNLDTSRLDEYLTPRTRAVMTVHLYGRVSYAEALANFVRSNGLKLIEDSAQAIGARHHGRAAGSLGDAAAFSFYPTKNIGALGDAGAVTTSDTELARIVRMLANYGSEGHYDNIYQGFNCRLDPVQAAMLSVKLPHTDAENDLRRAVAAEYMSRIDNPLVALPAAEAEPERHVYHQFVVTSPCRDRLRLYLEANGVGTGIHYPVAIHRQPCYAAQMGHMHLPVAERLAGEVLSLPVSRCTTVDDAREI